MAPVRRGLGWSLLAHEIKSGDGLLGASTSHATSAAPDMAPPAAAVATTDPGPSLAAARITPAVLFITVVLAVVLLASGMLHILRRMFIKTHRANARAEAVERQLQQLFHLHEDGAGPGLDQATIDALPAFAYAELSGAKGGGGRQFDCAVCLSEFAAEDRLRLLPLCGHAFHLACIDTWLASSSTCPLCRTVLSARALATAAAAAESASAEPDIEEQKVEEAPKQAVVLPVRLGRFKSVQGSATADGETGTASSSRLDGRRCFSMASSYQYVLADDDLLVSVRWRPGDASAAMRCPGVTVTTAGSDDQQSKKVCAASRRDSFSVSKIWQWRRSGGRRLPGLRTGSSSPTDDALPWASPASTRSARQDADT
uniref:Uncharacterized protein n=1 Tax=Avena sativa TaxID=4498 RepID=A0ACD5XRE6_AVESA